MNKKCRKPIALDVFNRKWRLDRLKTLINTRSSAVAKRPRVASCHCRACVSPHLYSIETVSRTITEIFSVKEWSDLEIGVGVLQCHWKWRLSIDHTHDFLLVGHRKYSSVVPFSSYLTLNNHDLEIWVIGHWRSFKLVPSESLGAVFYSPSIVTMAVSLTVYEIFSVTK